MNKLSLDAIAREQSRRASTSTSGRSARTVVGGHEHRLRQTVISLAGGAVEDSTTVLLTVAKL